MTHAEEKVFMRFNNTRAHWEQVRYTWQEAITLLGVNYDLKCIMENGEEKIRLKTP